MYRSASAPVVVTSANLVSGRTPISGGYTENLPTAGGIFYYVVTAVDTHGNESAPSRTAEFESDDTAAPLETALNARASESEEGITLTWDASEVTSDDFVGYWFVRSTKPNAAGYARNLLAAGVKGTSVTDPAPTPGTTYYYWVVAVDDAGNLGTPSQDVVITPTGNTTAPAAVTGVSATAQENGVTLAWDASQASGFDHYLMYRGTLADGEWVYKPLLQAGHAPLQITETTHKDLNPADGEQVRYSVVAVDQYGNAIGPGNTSAVAIVPELDLSPTVEDPSGGPFLGLGAAGDGRISWTLSTDPRNISAFNIYRWNHDTQEFALIGTDPGNNSGTGIWVDNTEPRGTTVYYRVTALWMDGTESGATEAVTATFD